MKLKHILLFGTALVLGACGARTNNPNDLIIPIVQAVQNDNESKLQCMLPTEEQIKKGIRPNGGPFGGVYYNKYTADYRLQTMQAQVHNQMEIIRKISNQDGLNWRTVEVGPTNREENNEANPGYTQMTTLLRFGNQLYELRYNLVLIDNDWRLYNYVGLFRHRS